MHTPMPFLSRGVWRCFVSVLLLCFLALPFLFRSTRMLAGLRVDEAPPPSPLPFTTGKRLVDLAASFAVAEVEKTAAGYVFPPISVSYVTITEMHLQNFSLKALKVGLASPSPDNLTVSVVDLSLAIPDTEFVFKYGIFTCPGVFRLKMGKTQLSFNVHPSTTNETLSVAVDPEATNATWGELEFEHDLDTVLCRIGQSIVQVFVGQMDELVERNIKEQLPPKLSTELVEKANQALADSGLRFSAPLVMTPARSTSQIELIPRDSSSPVNAAALHVLAPPAEAALPYKDLAATLYSTSVNHYFAYAVGKNELNTSFLLPENMTSEDLKDVFPLAYELCENCTVGLGLAAVVAPELSFVKAGSIARLRLSNAISGVFLLPQDAEQHVALLRRVDRLRGSRTAMEAFPSFALSPLCAFVSGSTARCPREGMDASWAVPVVAFAVNATLAVGDLAVVGARANGVQYRVHPVDDLALSLVASHMGPVDADKLTQDVAGVLNQFLIPLVNLDSPFTIPAPAKAAVIDVEDGSLTAGVNISFF